MEIFRRRVHVFAAGLLTAILIAVHAGDSSEIRENEPQSWFDLDTAGGGPTMQDKIKSEKSKNNQVYVKEFHEDEGSSVTKSLVILDGVNDHIVDFGGEYSSGRADEDDGLLFRSTPDSEETRTYWTKTITLKKCSANGENLNSGAKCVKSKGSIENSDLENAIGQRHNWLFTMVVTGGHVMENVQNSALSVSRVKVKYSSKLKCNKSECLGKSKNFINAGNENIDNEPDAKKKQPVYIQKDRSLVMLNNRRSITVNNSRYSSDIFIDASRKKDTKGLYCLREKRSIYKQTIFKKIRLPKNEGEFFTANFLLFVTALVFIVIYE